MAPGLADKLAADGYEVELVTCLHEIAPFSYETLEQDLLRHRMHTAGIRESTGVLVTSIASGRVEARDEFGEPLVLDADAVVLFTQRISNEGLYLELAGDACEIDAPTPAIPLPYLRERPLPTVAA